MCMCGKPTLNGQPGYRWNGPETSTHPVNAPSLDDNDTLLFDEPGRCGGLDCHSHHYRLVRRFGSVWLLVRHGGGQESFRISTTPALLEAWAAMDTTARFWTFHALNYAHEDGARDAKASEASFWRKAAAEKRIKTRKVRGSDSVRVTIEARASV